MGLLLGGHYKGSYTGSQTGAVVTLSPVGNWQATDPDIVGPYDTVIGLELRTDGTFWKYEATNDAPGGYSQIGGSTDWIIPRESASSSYEVMLTVQQNAPNFNFDSTGLWLAMSQTRKWNYRRTTSGGTNVQWTVSIRLNGGPTLATRAYSGFADNGAI